jgi:MarR family transcriptional regulator for hemolysin
LASSPEECTCEVLDAIPLVMQGIRNQFRRHGDKDLSVPQFRVLNFLSRHKNASLSEVAEHIGLMLPSMSTLVDGLVKLDFAVRQTSSDDRRRMTLNLTEKGWRKLRSARYATQAYLSRQFSHLSKEDRVTVIKAMQILKPIFAEKEP